MKLRTRLGFVLIALVLAWESGCGRDPEPPVPEQALVPIAPPEERVWVRHILIQYQGASQAPQHVTRNKAAAESLATALHARVEAGEDFAVLASQFSDDASAESGGEMASPVLPGDTPLAFERAALALGIDETSPVVESPFGFHIIRRRDVRQFEAQHILIRYSGAVNCPDSIVRTRDEALVYAEKLLAEVRKPDASFPVAAEIYSEDEATAPRGGSVGSFGRGKMDPAFEETVRALALDEISGLVETPFGIHIIRRVDSTPIRVSHILISYSGSTQYEETANRDRENALAQALDVLFRLQQGEDFASLAEEFSDDEWTSKKGGRMPMIRRGHTVPRFEEAAFALQPGEISDVVETQFGFHIIKRHY